MSLISKVPLSAISVVNNVISLACCSVSSCKQRSEEKGKSSFEY